MCQHEADSSEQKDDVSRADGNAATDVPAEAFPWDLGVFDAHCHPTDVMSSTANIPGLRSRALVIMATRSQDQELVAQLAASYATPSRESLSVSDGTSGHVIPSFGWHPWFSHQLYDDTAAEPTYRSVDSGDAKAATANHYRAVLQPGTEDVEFFSALPAPTALSEFINSTRKRLQEHPLALVGEVGVDKAFRLPRLYAEDPYAVRDDALTPGTRDGKLLSRYHVKPSHQVTVLAAQLALAGELERAISLHGVQAHGYLYDALAATWKGHEREVIGRRKRRMVAEGAEDFWSSGDEEDEEDEDEEKKKKKTTTTKPKKEVVKGVFPPRICLHSFSGSAEILKQYFNPAIPAKIFFSFSSAINLGTAASAARLLEVVPLVPDDRILVESDLHTAGQEMDAALEEMYRKVCGLKGWSLRDGVERIGRNFEEFVFG